MKMPVRGMDGQKSPSHLRTFVQDIPDLGKAGRSGWGTGNKDLLRCRNRKGNRYDTVHLQGDPGASGRHAGKAGKEVHLL